MYPEVWSSYLVVILQYFNGMIKTEIGGFRLDSHWIWLAIESIEPLHRIADVHPFRCPDPLGVDLERQALAVFTLVFSSLQVKLIDTKLMSSCF